MCGIAGHYGSFDRDFASRCAEALAHRGPDGGGMWESSSGDVRLVHRRLAIIDLSESGHQPMADPAGKVVVVFNGEIYNFRELRRDLEAVGHVFRGASDTEVLLNAYLEHGRNVLNRLNGVFAFAIYDTRDATLFVARDHYGVKPLYYSETPRGFVFASEMKAILAERSVSRKLDVPAMLRYLTLLWSPGEATPLTAVRKVLPGHAIVVRYGQVVDSWRYHRIVFSEIGGGRNVRETAREVAEALRTAVRRQMVADVPVGAFLSGGLDSSAVVAFAREFRGEPIDCFTVSPTGRGFREEGVEEDLPYARKVAAFLDVRLHSIDVGSDAIGLLPSVIYHLDEPQADPAAMNVLMISELARAHGIKVLLSGTAGDDLFSGYRRHQALLGERHWAWLPRSPRRVLGSAVRRLPQKWPTARRLTKAFQYAGEDGDARLLGYFYWLDPRLLGPLFIESLGDARAIVQAPFAHALGDPSPSSGLNRMLRLEQEFFLPDHNLNYTDKLSMARGVEVRVPFLDLELAALANSLPVSVKHTATEGKSILKKAMEPYLPRDVIYRPKTGFGAPLRYWLRNQLRDAVDDCLSESSLRSRGIFDAGATRRLIERDRTGEIDGSYTVFALLCNELWCRSFIDVDIPRPAS